MGEYADDHFRDEIMRKFGVDPGSMYSDGPNRRKKRPACPKCGKLLHTERGVADHLRDKHDAADQRQA